MKQSLNLQLQTFISQPDRKNTVLEKAYGRRAESCAFLILPPNYPVALTHPFPLVYHSLPSTREVTFHTLQF